MGDVAIKVEGLGKKYEIGHKKEGDLRNAFGAKLSKLLGKTSNTKEDFWALKDIDFEIKKGEAVGIIGRNGAGKSTLLKILSRITEPTTGRFEINGRVSSLLEVGTGFHMELSGRENIYLNGTILGMKRAEIKAKFDEIVAFSGVEKFIDTPVKHYSSGMKVRLAFSVAAHLEPEILIVDEVLAVGDAEFQKKCLGKMDEVSKNEGRTVLFVSHNILAVEKLCGFGVLLNGGQLESQGNISSIVGLYTNLSKKDNDTLNLSIIKDKSNLMIKNINFYSSHPNNVIASGVKLKIEIGIQYVGESFEGLIRLLFKDKYGNTKFLCNNQFTSHSLIIHNGINSISCTLNKLPLFDGNYSIDIRIASVDRSILSDYVDVVSFYVDSGDYFGSGELPKLNDGVLVEHYFSYE
ncbi:ABC transporter ATP-binding protein [Fulvivirga maritima]|uniref:ABC transporter ATP-binding protein n=1 Tax=Fulvivirga maritima TaxID=2904247 RepID=UPI001F24680B|nr:ABC transporter ATP-binding protein [Fulvivirga maritima]UII27793.1 ABC transporter ATP-binding protein [Fulvivirga maritima]